jgi:hypothetical protein
MDVQAGGLQLLEAETFKSRAKNSNPAITITNAQRLRVFWTIAMKCFFACC